MVYEFEDWFALVGSNSLKVDGVLSIGECREFICFAEALGFDHQGSLGAAGGEVSLGPQSFTRPVFLVL